MGISISQKGSFKNTEAFLKKMHSYQLRSTLVQYAQVGVRALAANTPVRSGRTASAWGYEVVREGKTWSIHWTNDNVHEGLPIAIILQYGHGTGTGGYVSGRDYINPAIQPVFDAIANEVWKAVTSA